MYTLPIEFCNKFLVCLHGEYPIKSSAIINLRGVSTKSGTPERGAQGGPCPPRPFSRGAGGGAKVPFYKVLFYKVYFINVYMWTEPYHLSIVNHLLSTICSEIVTTAYRFLISAL